ncbi:MAG: isopentenyl phosphate kinase family protein [Methanomicrobiales archaeon]|nr:isopentenyl phosphate kinase family protein [Methanomicrobiales archaeon]
MSEGTILKLGGSILTNKSGDCTINHHQLLQIAGDIDRGNARFLLLVHGAGSCGHPQAKKYHLDVGLSAMNIQGVYETHAAVQILNTAVVNALRTRGVEAVGISPLACAVARDGRLIALESRPLSRMLEKGIVPVLHGDVVMDERRGASIISGDQLVTRLAIDLSMNRVGLATDVAGVLHKGQVIPHIYPEEVYSLDLRESPHADVTGGMRGKIQELVALAEQGIESHVFHVTRIRNFLEGSAHGGTIVGGEGA